MLFLFGLLERFPYGLPYPVDALLVRMRIHPPYGAAIGMFQTCGTWQNLTATTANTVTGAFERTLDAAWGKVSTGAFDYKTAVKQAVDSLAEFAQATGGRVDSARTSVPKFGRSEASRASAQARKASSTYSSLNTKAKPVTMQSIANVKAFSCDTLDAAGQQQLKNAHKRLLMVASKQPENVEIGRVFNIKMKPLTKDITGSTEGSSVQLPNFDTPYVVIHTHPACGIFSHGDLSSFTRNKNLKLMTAIGHNGHIYAVEKSINYNAAAANGIVWDLNAEINRLKNIPRAELSDEKLLEQAEKLIRQAIGDLQENGVKYYE